MTARSWPPSRRAQTARRLLLSLHTIGDSEPKREFRESQGPISWRPDPSLIGQWTLAGWLLGTVALGLVQMSRIIRFRALLREAVPAPDWLADEAQRMGDRLGVRVPEILAVPCLGTPMLWCLGRPKLLLPCRFLKSIEAVALARDPGPRAGPPRPRRPLGGPP